MYRFLIAALILAALCGCVTSMAQQTVERNNFVDQQDTLPYRLIHPQREGPGKKYPLVIYLHGSGSRGTDNEKPLQKLPSILLDSAMRAAYPCFILVPQCPEEDAWVSFPGFPESLESRPTKAQSLTIQLIRHLIAVGNIDPKRVYLTGYSLGAEGTYDMLARTADLFACGVPLAGLGDTSKAHLLTNIPLRAFHGTDDKVIDIRYHRLIVNAIRQKGGSIKFTALQGVGHDCKEAYNDPELWRWVFSQKKKR